MLLRTSTAFAGSRSVNSTYSPACRRTAFRPDASAASVPKLRLGPRTVPSVAAASAWYSTNGTLAPRCASCAPPARTSAHATHAPSVISCDRQPHGGVGREVPIVDALAREQDRFVRGELDGPIREVHDAGEPLAAREREDPLGRRPPLHRPVSERRF